MANRKANQPITPDAFLPNRGPNRLIVLLIILLGSLILGMMGYITLEGYSPIEAFYMSVITISTVGFSEVRPLSDPGRIFTGIYIIVNLGIFAYVVSVLTAYLFEGELNKIYRNYLSRRELKRMKDHIIVCGFGRNGIKACEELYASNKPFVVIERDQEMLEHYSQSQNYSVIVGDAIYDEVLTRAGIHKASSIITTLPSDADNVYITLTAREANRNIFIVARASEENSERKLYRAGANKVVMPDALGGLHMAQLVTKPYVIEFLNLLNGVGTGKTKLELEEFSYEELRNDFKDKSIRDLDVRNRTGATIIGFKDDEEGFLFNPAPSTHIGARDILIVLGSLESIQEFRKAFTLRPPE